jgi:hypothetical protein
MESVRKDIEDVYSQLKGCFRIFAFLLHKKSQVDNVVLSGMALASGSLVLTGVIIRMVSLLMGEITE